MGNHFDFETNKKPKLKQAFFFQFLNNANRYIHTQKHICALKWLIYEGKVVGISVSAGMFETCFSRHAYS